MNASPAVSLLLLAALWAWALPAPAGTTVTTDHARVTLLAAPGPPRAGDTWWLGLRFELIPHWHVYWRNPGASGTAPAIRWDLPAGWRAGDIHWPVPARIRVGPLTNYGYEDTVTLMVPVAVPAGWPAGRPARIEAAAEWLVCREACIPESGRFTLALGDRAATDSEAPAAFAAARERWPRPGTVAGDFRLAGDTITLDVPMPEAGGDRISDIWFAAHRWGPVDASAPQRWERAADRLILEVPAGDVPPAADAALDGLLVVETGAADAPRREGHRLRLTAGPPAADTATAGLATALALAFAGGLVLNVMPCVLPVLGIKVMGFVAEARARRRRLALHGGMYAAGILASFAVLAAVLLALRAGGESLGWGFQLQSPLMVTLLAYLMLLVGLNLSGVFAVGGGLMGAGQSAAAGTRPANTFATGVLAAVVASPCTAPFMGAALGFAVTRPAAEALAVFLALGAGFALPVVALSLWPAWLRRVPRPGPWMERLRQLLAFPMYATSAWLVWVLSQQADARAYGMALAGLVAIALAAWIYGQWRPRGWRLGALGAGTAAALTLVLGPMAASDTSPAGAATADPQAWSEARVRELTAAGRPVFVNFTAAWCITCKVNEQVALATPATRRLFESRGVSYLVADWTRRDAAITRQLARHGRNGVPLYLLYGPGAEAPVVLPQLLTTGLVAEAVARL